MRKHLKIYLIFICTIFLFNNVYAKDIDISKMGNLKIENSYSNVKLDNTKVEIYKVALLDQNLKYKYEEKFINASQKDLTGVNDSEELLSIAKNLSKYINQNNIEPLKVSVTNQEGNIEINNLSLGVYLIRSEDKTINNINYYSDPVLVSIPLFDELYNDYLYDVKINLKTEKKNVDDPIDPDNPDINNSNNDSFNDVTTPNTFDKIYYFISIFIVSIFITLIILGYIYKESKKNNK